MRIDAAATNSRLPIQLLSATARGLEKSAHAEPARPATAAAPASPAILPETPVSEVKPPPSPNSRFNNALDVLFKHWGTADEACDLNADGTVNGLDLGMLIWNFSQAAQNQSQPEPTQPQHTPTALEMLLAAWGNPDATRFDLNEDGTVNGLDLGIMLQNMSNTAADSAATQAAAAPGQTEVKPTEDQTPVHKAVDFPEVKASASDTGRLHAATAARLGKVADLIATRVRIDPQSSAALEPLKRSIRSLGLPHGHAQMLISKLADKLPRGVRFDEKV
jgi:hypothetical protein